MDRRKYRGYVVKNAVAKNRYEQWVIKFPDFPTLQLVTGNEALDPHPMGRVVEDCSKLIIDAIIDLISSGAEAPKAAEVLSYRPYIDVEVDLDVIQAVFALRKPN